MADLSPDPAACHCQDLLDREAIRRLIAVYCDALARRDADAAGALFSADARLRITDFPELTGRDAITRGMRETFASFAFIEQRCDTGLIDIAGNRAWARLNVFEIARKPGANSLGLIFGVYEDEYVRLAEGWRFASRDYALRMRGAVAADRLSEIAAVFPLRDFRA